MANTTFRSEVKWTGTGLESDAQAGEHVESSCPVKNTLSGVSVERA